ncbi:unnamed protein product (macronuclear) [Paramecium tetraurelia]|uniref:Uncharacterized protein n=1 Tax=Paramecium tetraurelia TaxID=5888 RepID=A0BN87_PARTE|nr:uncharacterized protein GSPATT00030642001 [Paramecium tetraurelia]CAK60004.1 unnamed protein product [Paramecium tetraurelia]|eukprot:XP_001427402.1 hypothetical protein (macronuclear) [Paramecium tetraurelia strain d4-2]
MKKNKLDTLKTIKDFITQLQQLATTLSDMINELSISDELIQNQSYQDLTRDIKNIIKIEKSDKLILDKIPNIVTLVSALKQDIKSIQSSQGPSQVIEEPLSGYIINSTQEQTSQSNNNNSQVIITQVQSNFIFSKKNKHEDIQLSFQNKEARSSSILLQTRYILSEEVITENSIARIKVQCGEAVSIGICHQNIVFQNDKAFEGTFIGYIYFSSYQVLTSQIMKGLQQRVQKTQKIHSPSLLKQVLAISWQQRLILEQGKQPGTIKQQKELLYSLNLLLEFRIT